MIRLLTAFINFNCNKIKDEFSGDYLTTLEDGDAIVGFLENREMLPPKRDKQITYDEIVNSGYEPVHVLERQWDEEGVEDEKV